MPERLHAQTNQTEISKAWREYEALAARRIAIIQNRPLPWRPEPLIEVTKALEENKIKRLKLVGIYPA